MAIDDESLLLGERPARDREILDLVLAQERLAFSAERYRLARDFANACLFLIGEELTPNVAVLKEGKVIVELFEARIAVGVNRRRILPGELLFQRFANT